MVNGRGRAYRMGGDEFCALLERRDDDPLRLGRILARALHATGEKFSVGCSYGVVELPAEAASTEDALRTAAEASSRNREDVETLITRTLGRWLSRRHRRNPVITTIVVEE